MRAREIDGRSEENTLQSRIGTGGMGWATPWCDNGVGTCMRSPYAVPRLGDIEGTRIAALRRMLQNAAVPTALP